MALVRPWVWIADRARRAASEYGRTTGATADPSALAGKLPTMEGRRGWASTNLLRASYRLPIAWLRRATLERRSLRKLGNKSLDAVRAIEI